VSASEKAANPVIAGLRERTTLDLIARSRVTGCPRARA
jgi:hypothetical protein